MYKRIITLLTTMLIITLGTFYPINVYASEDIEIDEDYDDSYVDDVTTVDIDYDTRLRTSDYYGIKYQTVVNCNFRSTDDRYYSYNIFGVRSASEWWTFHTKMGGTWNEEYGTFGYMTKWPTGEDRFLATSAKIIGEQDYNMKTNMENYLSNIRRVNTPNASNETFIDYYVTDSSFLSSRYPNNVSPGRWTTDASLQLDWRWFVCDANDWYRIGESSPAATPLPMSYITPYCISNPDGSNKYNISKKYWDAFERHYATKDVSADMIEITVKGNSLGWSAEKIEQAKTAYKYVSALRFLIDYDSWIFAQNSSAGINGSVIVNPTAISSVFDPISGTVDMDNEVAKSFSFEVAQTASAGVAYVLFNNTNALTTPMHYSYTGNLADPNAYDGGYYLYIFMHAGVARNSTECVNMLLTDVNDELATYYGLDYDTFWKVSHGGLGSGYYDPNNPYWDGDIVKPIYKYDTFTRDTLYLNYNNNYSKYHTKANLGGTKEFTSNSGGHVYLCSAGDFSVQLYQVSQDSDWLSQASTLKPIDQYNKANTWAQVLDKAQTNNFYTLRTGIGVSVASIKAPELYEFDKVTYTKTEENVTGYNDSDMSAQASELVYVNGERSFYSPSGPTALSQAKSITPITTYQGKGDNVVEKGFAYGWCGNLTNHKSYLETSEFNLLKNMDGYNYISTDSMNKASDNFKNNSIVYKITYPSNTASNNIVTAYYITYFNTATNRFAAENLARLRRSLTAYDESFIVGERDLYYNGTLLNSAGVETPNSIYLGTVNDLYDRSYHMQYWKAINSDMGCGNSDMANRYALGVHYDQPGENGKTYGDTMFYAYDGDGNSVANAPYNQSAISYAANVYHWVTAESYKYNGFNSSIFTKSQDLRNLGMAGFYDQNLMFAWDWYRAQPVSEITVWYKPKTYKVVYHTNFNTYTSALADSSYTYYSDTSITKGEAMSSSLVWYDDYEVVNFDKAFVETRLNGDGTATQISHAGDIREQAASAGLTFDHWCVGSPADSGEKLYPTGTSAQRANCSFSARPGERASFDYYRQPADHVVHIYAIYRDDGYAVTYNSNEGDDSKTFPHYGNSIYKEGYVKANKGATEPSYVLSVDRMNELQPEEPMTKPGYFIAGWQLCDNGHSANDTCGTDYYNGRNFETATSTQHHNNLFSNALALGGNINERNYDSKNIMYGATYYNSNNEKLSEITHRLDNLRGAGNYAIRNVYYDVSPLIPGTVPSITDRSVFDITKDPTDGNIGYYDNYVVCVNNYDAYREWKGYIDSYNTDCENITSSSLNSFKSVFGNLDFSDLTTDANTLNSYSYSKIALNDYAESIARHATVIEDTLASISNLSITTDNLATKMSELNVTFANELSAISSDIFSLKAEANGYNGDNSSTVNYFVNKYTSPYSPNCISYVAIDYNNQKDNINTYISDVNNPQGSVNSRVEVCFNNAFIIKPMAVFYAHWEPIRFYIRYNYNDANNGASTNLDGVRLDSQEVVESVPDVVRQWSVNNESLRLKKGQFSIREARFGDPTFKYEQNKWVRDNMYTIEQNGNKDNNLIHSTYLGWNDEVITTGPNAYEAAFQDGTTIDYDRVLDKMTAGSDGNLSKNNMNFIYDLYAIFDDWPLLYIHEKAQLSGYSLLSNTLKVMTDGYTGSAVDSNSLNQLEQHLLSAETGNVSNWNVNIPNSFRLVTIAYDREDSARGAGSSEPNQNGWSYMKPDVNVIESGRPTGYIDVVKVDPATGKVCNNDRTAFPEFIGIYKNSNDYYYSCKEYQFSHVMMPTDLISNRTNTTRYYLRFFDPSYVNSTCGTETKYDLRFYISDRYNKGYERQGTLYSGEDGISVNIMVNGEGAN